MSTKKVYPVWVISGTCLCCGVSKDEGKIVCETCFNRMKKGKPAAMIYQSEQSILEACIDAKEREEKYPTYNYNSTTCQVCGGEKSLVRIACDSCYNDEVCKRIGQLTSGMMGRESDQVRLNICIDVFRERNTQTLQQKPACPFQLTALVCPFQLTEEIAYALPVGTEIFFNDEKVPWKREAGSGWVSSGRTFGLPNIVFSSNKYRVTRLLIDGKVVSTSQVEVPPKYGFSHNRESWDPQENGSFLPKTRLGDVDGFQLHPPKPKVIMMVDDQSDPP